MDGTAALPLSGVLRREQGTLRFGYALRLLGRQNPAILREITDDLQTVQTRDGLQLILWHAAQACQVALAHSPFLIVPDDTDYQYLLEDVEQHGTRTIASLLLVLSALRYARNPTDSMEPAEADSATTTAGEGINGQPGSDPDL